MPNRLYINKPSQRVKFLGRDSGPNCNLRTGNIKNVLVAVVVGLLAVVLVGCESASAGGGSEEQQPAEEPEQGSEPEDTTDSPDGATGDTSDGSQDGSDDGATSGNDGSGTSYAEGTAYTADAGLTLYDDEDDGSDDIAAARYLEAAPAETEWDDREWGDRGDNGTVAGDAQLLGIGDGQAATDAIVAHMEGKSITGTAAQLANGLSHGGYSDWFLPSKDELDRMYQKLAQTQNNIGGFAAAYYWAASEVNASRAWYQNFGDGSQSTYPKYLNYRVRAVRAF